MLIAGNQSQARENAPCVRVNHKHRTVEGVKQDVIGGFGSDPVNIQKRMTQVMRGEFRKLIDTALLDQPATHGFQAFGLDVEVAGGSEPGGEAPGMLPDNRL